MVMPFCQLSFSPVFCWTFLGISKPIYFWKGSKVRILKKNVSICSSIAKVANLDFQNGNFIIFECMLVKVIRTIIMVITGKSKEYFTIHFTIHHHCHLNDKSYSLRHFHIQLHISKVQCKVVCDVCKNTCGMNILTYTDILQIL